MSYRLSIYNNAHYQNEAPTKGGRVYDTFEEAVAACKAIVDRSLESYYKPGMKADDLYDYYTSFEDDPSIIGHDMPYRFSAWNYADERSKEMCGKAISDSMKTKVLMPGDMLKARLRPQKMSFEEAQQQVLASLNASRGFKMNIASVKPPENQPLPPLPEDGSLPKQERPERQIKSSRV